MPGRPNRARRPRAALTSNPVREAEIALRLQCLKLGNAFEAGGSAKYKFETAREIYDWVTTPVPPSTAERRRAASRAKPEPNPLAQGMAHLLAALVRQRGGLPAPARPPAAITSNAPTGHTNTGSMKTGDTNSHLTAVR